MSSWSRAIICVVLVLLALSFVLVGAEGAPSFVAAVFVILALDD